VVVRCKTSSEVTAVRVKIISRGAVPASREGATVSAVRAGECASLGGKAGVGIRARHVGRVQ